MNRDLQEIPKFEDNWSFLYFEMGHIEQDQKSVAYFAGDSKIPIPVETLSLLMLGPGTVITHEAVKRLSDSRCQIAWVGEEGVRFYSLGYSGTYSSRNLLQQVAVYSNDFERMKVIKRMYSKRFDEEVGPGVTIEQMRGKEGARVRQTYKELAEKHGVEWKRREYNQNDWNSADPLNIALSAANAVLYGLVHSAILSVGCSPAIGFVHTGKQLSFVYDMADLYKTEITIPVAFEEAKTDGMLETRVRKRLRDQFKQTKLIKRIIPDIMEMLYGNRDTGEIYAGTEGRDVAVNSGA